MILSDNETKVDLLNYEAIATTIVTLLRQRPDRPITLGVHGDWGAGKSSVLEMIEAELEKDEKVNYLCHFRGALQSCRYGPWPWESALVMVTPTE